MNTVLHIVIDTSGSMSAMGKAFVLRNLCRFIAQFPRIASEKYADVQVLFYRWGTDLCAISLHDDGDIPSFTAQGSVQLSTLLEFMLSRQEADGDVCVLLLSDGNFAFEDVVPFQQRRDALAEKFGGIMTLGAIGVGADADVLALQKIAQPVYHAENIHSAVEEILCAHMRSVSAPPSLPSPLPPLPPSSLAQIQMPPTTMAEEEDWDA